MPEVMTILLVGLLKRTPAATERQRIFYVLYDGEWVKMARHGCAEDVHHRRSPAGLAQLERPLCAFCTIVVVLCQSSLLISTPNKSRMHLVVMKGEKKFR